MDERLKRAASIMRKRWDQWNADHGIEYDYDQCDGCHFSDDTDDENNESGWNDDDRDKEDDEFYADYCYTKKSGFSAT
jgi:hypothetical protein